MGFVVLLKMTPAKTTGKKKRRSPEKTVTGSKIAEFPGKTIREMKPSSKLAIKEEQTVKREPIPVESDLSMLPDMKDELAELDDLKAKEAAVDSDLRRLWSRISS